VQLGSGPAIALSAATGAGAADVTLVDEHGAQLHLDFSGYTGGDVIATVSGAGSISLDGSTWVALDFAATDLELTDASAGRILHVDTTGIHSAGSELVTFDGTVNAFDALQGIADDLANIDGLSTPDLIARLTTRLAELDRNFENLQLGQGVLGATSERLASGTERLTDLDLAARELLSKTEDADLSAVILDLTRAEQTLQATQATGARLIQNTLLDYLR
jgi:flagellin-like hook-associated protein FlgL